MRGFLKLAKGLPSHDTFSRLFRQLDPEQFRAVFQRFMSRFSIPCQGVIAIDGKVLAGPAPRPLDRYETKIDGKKLLLGRVITPERQA